MNWKLKRPSVRRSLFTPAGSNLISPRGFFRNRFSPVLFLSYYYLGLLLPLSRIFLSSASWYIGHPPLAMRLWACAQLASTNERPTHRSPMGPVASTTGGELPNSLSNITSVSGRALPSDHP